MVLVAVVALVLIGTSYGRDAGAPSGDKQPEAAPTRTAPSAAEPTVADGQAASALEKLAVKGRAPRTGYDREQFGQSWRDLDRNGCDQRNDVLRRDLRGITLQRGTRGCLVLRGTLTSPYSGEVVDFVRGTTTSRTVQIDHVVALADAWQKGAQQWSPDKREQFANDVLELRATDMHTNASKGAGDAATWLPPRSASRCAYVARQIAVKQAYGLWVTTAERDAMRRVLTRCPKQTLPSRQQVPLGGGPEADAPA